jgi:hypothetical protein
MPTHQAKPGTNLISEFALNLIQVNWQLTIGADHVTGDRRYDFFMGWSQTQLAILPILQGKHDAFGFSVSVPPTRFTP